MLKLTSANQNDSEKYRSIAISSSLSKYIVINIIIKQQVDSLKTSGYQFVIKPKPFTFLVPLWRQKQLHFIQVIMEAREFIIARCLNKKF